MQSLSERPVPTRPVSSGLQPASEWAMESWVLVLLYSEGFVAV